MLTIYMVHMGINQRLDKARQKHPSWLGKPKSTLRCYCTATALIQCERATRAEDFPRPGLCAHGGAGLRQPLTHVRAPRRGSRVCCPSWQLCGGRRNEGESHRPPGLTVGHGAQRHPSPLRKAWAPASRQRAPKIPGTGQGRCCRCQVARSKAVCKGNFASAPMLADAVCSRAMVEVKSRLLAQPVSGMALHGVPAIGQRAGFCSRDAEAQEDPSSLGHWVSVW